MATHLIAPTPLSASLRRWWLPERDSYAALSLVAMMSMMITIGVTRGAIRFDHNSLDPTFLSLGLIWTIGLALHAVRCPRLGDGMQLLSVFFAGVLLAALASALLATSARPYADVLLASADRALLPGFDWPGTMLAWQRYPQSLLLLTHAYGGLQWEPLILLISLSASRRTDRAWQFVTAWMAALFICLVVFPLVPARGAYVHFGITPAQVPAVGLHVAWSFLPLLEGVRDGTIGMLDTMTLDGIITMPSFHAAGAVVLGWSAWQFRAARWPLTLLNAAILVSSVPIGGHYLIDVAAGAGIGGTAVLLARWIHREPAVLPVRPIMPTQ